MSTMIKYDVKTRVTMIELYAKGYQIQEIAEQLGVHRATIYRWIKRDAKLDDAMKRARGLYVKEASERALIRSIEGVEREEITEEYIIERDGKPIKRKVRRVKEAPNLKAIGIVARLYDIEELKDYDSEGPVTNILNVSTDSLSMREVQTLLANSPSDISNLERDDVRDVELTASDYKDLEAPHEENESGDE